MPDPIASNTLTPNIAELRKVVAAVRATSDERFTMSAWMRQFGGCGSAGCAIGNFCFYNPESPMRLVPDRLGCLVPAFNGRRSYEAVAAYFCIPEDDAAELFSPDSYDVASREAVIERIEKFIADHA